MATKPKIGKIVVKRMEDTDPDLSFIGQYKSDVPGNVEEWRVFDRKALGVQGHNEFRYFIANEVENREQAKQNLDEMEAIGRGEKGFFGIRAEAEVLVPSQRGGDFTIQKITSGGLWGIESDSEASYFREVAIEEVLGLANQLKAFGFTKAQVRAAPLVSEDIPLSMEAVFRSGVKVVRPRVGRTIRGQRRGPGKGWHRQSRRHAKAARLGHRRSKSRRRRR